MKSRLLAMTLITVLLFGLFSTNVVGKGNGNGNAEILNINLRLDESQEALSVYSTESFEIANKNFVDYNAGITKNVFMNLTLRIDSTTQKTMGSGVLKLEDRAYPFTLEGILYSFTLSDGKTVFYGPQDLDIKIKGEKEKSIIGLYIDPIDQTYIASITIGALGKGDNSTAYLSFGEQNDSYRNAMDEIIRSKNIPRTENVNELLEDEAIEEAAEDFHIMAHQEFKYGAAAQRQYLTNNYNGYDEREYTANWVIYHQVYVRGPQLQGNGNGIMNSRVFSNTLAVENHVRGKGGTNPQAVVDRVRFQFGLDPSESVTNGIHIHRVDPADSGRIDNITIFSYIPKVGTILDILVNRTIDLINANPPITSKDLKKVGTSIVQKEKSVGGIWGRGTGFTCFSNTSASSIPNAETTAGGISAKFWFTEDLDGYGFLFSKADIMYYVSTSNHYYRGYFVTDWTNISTYMNFGPTF